MTQQKSSQNDHKKAHKTTIGSNSAVYHKCRVIAIYGTNISVSDIMWSGKVDLTSQRLAEDLILTNHIQHLPAEQHVLTTTILTIYYLRTPT